MVSLINKQLLLTAYAYLFIMEQQKAQQGSEGLQMQSSAGGESDGGSGGAKSWREVIGNNKDTEDWQGVRGAAGFFQRMPDEGVSLRTQEEFKKEAKKFFASTQQGWTWTAEQEKGLNDLAQMIDLKGGFRAIDLGDINIKLSAKEESPSQQPMPEKRCNACGTRQHPPFFKAYDGRGYECRNLGCRASWS